MSHTSLPHQYLIGISPTDDVYLLSALDNCMRESAVLLGQKRGREKLDCLGPERLPLKGKTRLINSVIRRILESP